MGTTKEWLHELTQAQAHAHAHAAASAHDGEQKEEEVEDDDEAMRHAVPAAAVALHGDHHGIRLNSIVSDAALLEEGSLVEHSILSAGSRIGAGCIVSHVCEHIGKGLYLPSGIALQRVPLHRHRHEDGHPSAAMLDPSLSSPSSCSSYALIVMGVDDNPKTTYDDHSGAVAVHVL